MNHKILDQQTHHQPAVEDPVFSGDIGSPRYTRGDEHQIGFLLDDFNGRLNVLSYSFNSAGALARHLFDLARAHRLSKIFIKVREDEWEALIPYGFVLEGIIKGFFKGEHAYCMSRFLTRQRRFSPRYEEADAVMETLRRDGTHGGHHPVPPDVTVDTATPDDAAELARVYESVFHTYPTPLNNPDYLHQAMQEQVIFRVARANGRIVSAASAMLDRNNRNAEMTDCATLPDYRGRGLVSALLAELEGEMYGDKMLCLYSMARSVSFGINLIFHRLGYAYQGRLTNHCHIMGSFADANLWVKRRWQSHVLPDPEASFEGYGEQD